VNTGTLDRYAGCPDDPSPAELDRDLASSEIWSCVQMLRPAPRRPERTQRIAALVHQLERLAG
jgi:hypothetical protein